MRGKGLIEKQLLNNKEPEFDDLENSHSIPKACARDRIKHSGQIPAKEIRYILITCESNQPCQQKPRIKIGLSRKGLWRTFLSDGTDYYELCGRPTQLLKLLY